MFVPYWWLGKGKKYFFLFAKAFQPGLSECESHCKQHGEQLRKLTLLPLSVNLLHLTLEWTHFPAQVQKDFNRLILVNTRSEVCMRLQLTRIKLASLFSGVSFLPLKKAWLSCEGPVLSSKIREKELQIEPQSEKKGFCISKIAEKLFWIRKEGECAWHSIIPGAGLDSSTVWSYWCIKARSYPIS